MRAPDAEKNSGFWFLTCLIAFGVLAGLYGCVRWLASMLSGWGGIDWFSFLLGVFYGGVMIGGLLTCTSKED